MGPSRVSTWAASNARARRAAAGAPGGARQDRRRSAQRVYDSRRRDLAHTTGQLLVQGRQPGSRVRVKPPKSPNGFRTLMLDVDTLKGLSGGATASGWASRYLFTGRTGRHPRPDNVTGRFNQIAVAAGVRPLGPHQIRHLIASNLLDAGFGIHEVAERLGHDPATLMRYYTRVNANRRMQATNHIAKLLTPLVDRQDRY